MIHTSNSLLSPRDLRAFRKIRGSIAFAIRCYRRGCGGAVYCSYPGGEEQGALIQEVTLREVRGLLQVRLSSSQRWVQPQTVWTLPHGEDPQALLYTRREGTSLSSPLYVTDLDQIC